MSKESKAWLYLITLSVIWGSSFILMKRGMFTTPGQPIFSDVEVASLRMVIAGSVLLPFAFRSMSKLKDIKTFLFLCVVGLCGNFFPAYLFTYAETGVSSGLAGMMNSFTPIFALTIGFFVFKERLNKLQSLGVVIGVVGVVLLMISGKNFEVKGEWSHIFAIVGATFCYAISVNTIKYKLPHLRSIELAALAFSVILLPSLLIGLKSGVIETIKTNEFALEGLFYITILSVIGTAMALIIFNKMISISSVLFATSVTYLIPIVAVVIGLYFGEQIGWIQIIAMGIVLLGVFIANYLGKKQVVSKKNTH
ncbi:MAG TPA: DMT family transporter [Crocinitomicaceae bacterium]|nr:DMT family transporter [Crocinitomicaceae bacterium]